MEPHLNQSDLSTYWNISMRTLERWRWQGLGPAYIKIGGRVLYRREDIEKYEASRRQQGLEQKLKVPEGVAG